ncbi:MAG: futalosine hydrolase [Phycisphaerae bacterium]|nr:futalosine hydrolase [Phycisphaerae bacterium]
MRGIDSDGLVVVASTDGEAAPFRARGLPVVVSGVGRVNAAVATTLAVTSRSTPPLVVAAGIAGALPVDGDFQGSPAIGSIVIADRCVYAEEGIITGDGFQTISDMGFPVATFAKGNSIPCDEAALDLIRSSMPAAVIGPIATVATCSGTDELASEIAGRTAAVAEAMEGAAVVHAARLLGATAVEIRTISNRTGDRDRQGWDLETALGALETVAEALVAR